MTRADQHSITEQIPSLRRYARALTGDKVRADDLVQDTLERAWSKRSLFVRHDNLRAWLFTIMHNLHVNSLRQLSRELDTEPLERDQEVSAGDGSHAESELMARDIGKALMALPPNQREILLLVGLEGLAYEEVAKILEIPAGTVMSRLHRAREMLRQRLNTDKLKGST